MGRFTLIGGAGRIRTGDPLLAKQVLCQLSYDPVAVETSKERMNLLPEIYFVRSTGTRLCSADLAIRFARPSTIDACAEAQAPSP